MKKKIDHKKLLKEECAKMHKLIQDDKLSAYQLYLYVLSRVIKIAI